MLFAFGRYGLSNTASKPLVRLKPVILLITESSASNTGTLSSVLMITLCTASFRSAPVSAKNDKGFAPKAMALSITFGVSAMNMPLSGSL